MPLSKETIKIIKFMPQEKTKIKKNNNNLKLCPKCGGDGWDASPSYVKVCKMCRGHGYVS